MRAGECARSATSAQSAVKPEALMIGPQRAVSAAMIAASCSALVPVGS